MSQSIKGVRAGLFAVCQSIYDGQTDTSGAPVLVSYGPPGSYQPQEIVAVGVDCRQPVTRPTLGAGRSREKEAEIDVVISVFVPGTEAEQQTASERCDDLADLLDSYFRTIGQETLGDSCREAWLSNISGPVPDLAVDPHSGAVTGRLAESTVTITARIRY